jgi:hypothetical protein
MEVKVPDIGDFKDVPVISILVAVGDRWRKEAPLIELESDKATMEVPSPAGGQGHGNRRQGRRQGVRGIADPDAGGRRRRGRGHGRGGAAQQGQRLWRARRSD